jgi:hypothetical protein
MFERVPRQPETLSHGGRISLALVTRSPKRA